MTVPGKKRGRPRLHPDEKLGIPVPVRMTSWHEEILDALAWSWKQGDRKRRSRGEVLRKLVEDALLAHPSLIEEFDRAIETELSELQERVYGTSEKGAGE